MNYNDYDQVADWVRRRPLLMGLIRVCNLFFTGIGFVLYPVFLFFEWRTGGLRALFFSVLIPGMGFGLVSLFRKLCNAERPYEIFPIHPLIPKDKKGESFPSRHIFSIFLIGGLWFFISLPVGSMILIFGVCLALIRVIGGVHFFKDVICGGMLGLIVAGLAGLFL